MPRDLSGNYTLPPSNPVITLTPIATSWANPTLADVAQSLTDSLDRQGRGGMLAPFKFADGSIGLPSGSFTLEPTLGFYRKGGAQFAIAASGADMGIFGPTTFTAPAGVLATGGVIRIMRTAATARINVDSDAGQAANVAFRTGTISRWQVGKETTAEGGANAGSNYLIERFDDAGVSLGASLSIIRSTGLASLPAGLLSIGGNALAAAALFQLNTAAAQSREVQYQTAGLLRWVVRATSTAESGANAGSDFDLTRYDDAGAALGTALSVIRSSGNATFGNSLTVNGPNLFVGTDAQASPQVRINGVAGTDKTISARTAAVLRWQVGASGAEGGANSGADWIFNRHDDAGVFLSAALVITRATGAVSINGGQITLNAGATPEPVFIINGGATTTRYHQINSSGVIRWDWGAKGSVESGGNVGSDWYLRRWSDAGAFIDRPIEVNRATGVVNFTATPTVAGSPMSVGTTVVNLTANQVIAGAAQTAIAGLATALLTGTRYLVRATLLLSNSNNTGYGLGATWTGGASTGGTNAFLPNGNGTASAALSQYDFSTVPAAATFGTTGANPTAGTTFIATFDTIFSPTAGAGTYTPTAASTGAGSLTVRAGSMLEIIRLA